MQSPHDLLDRGGVLAVIIKVVRAQDCRLRNLDNSQEVDVEDAEREDKSQLVLPTSQTVLETHSMSINHKRFDDAN